MFLVTHGVTCVTHVLPSPLVFFMWMVIVKYVKADSLRKRNKTFSRLNRYRKYIILRASNPCMTWQEGSRDFLLNCCANLTFLLCGRICSVLCCDCIHDHLLVFTHWTCLLNRVDYASCISVIFHFPLSAYSPNIYVYLVLLKGCQEVRISSF